jgi:hypothetical protein
MEVLPRPLPGGTTEKHTNKPQSGFGVKTGIRIEYLSNISQVRYL